MEENKQQKRIQKCYNIFRALIIITFLGSLILWAATAEATEKSDWLLPNQFAPVHAVDAFLSYTHPIRTMALSYLFRYDYMSQQELADAERHRFTAGLTLHLFPEQKFQTDLRLNYEKYLYAPNSSPKLSEQDKLVAELMLRF